MNDTFLDDFVDDSESAIEGVMAYINVVEALDHDIQLLEDQLKEKKERYDELVKKTLPTLLAENGLDSMTLANGKKLTIKEDIFVSLPKNDIGRKAVLTWLAKNGGVDLIKEDMIVEAPPEELKTFLSMRGIFYAQNTTVNGNSLKAWFKRKLGMTKGSQQEIDLNMVPKEANLYIERKVEIK